MAISEKKTSLLFKLSLSLTVFGALFKVLSWPLIILGASGMVIFHSIQLFQKESRLPLDYARQVLIVLFTLNFIFSTLGLHYADLLTVLTRTVLITFILLYAKEILTPFLKNSQNNLLIPNLNTENLSYLLADLATVYIVVASLFEILHWEFGIINANLLLVIGLFTAIISIVAGSVRLGK